MAAMHECMTLELDPNHSVLIIGVVPTFEPRAPLLQTAKTAADGFAISNLGRQISSIKYWRFLNLARKCIGRRIFRGTS